MAQKKLPKSESRLNKVVKRIENYIIRSLIAFMSILLMLATLELGYHIVMMILEDGDAFLIDLESLMGAFGIFMLVLIGIELLDTIKVYFKEHVIHVEVVMLVALIAVARKVIVMDYDKLSGIEMLGVAAIVLALAGGYYLIKLTGGCGFWPKEKEEEHDVIVEEKTIQETSDGSDDEKVIERKKIVKTKTQETPVEPPGDAREKVKLPRPGSGKK
jgi:uncharacterized membrane protein (DUF373 family)